MESSVGILALGSLIENPGIEIEGALVGRKLNVLTPFAVEFARSSLTRGGAPTLVPHPAGGPVNAQILLLNVSERAATDMLWRREINKVGTGGHYVHKSKPGRNTLVIETYKNFEGVEIVLAARFAPTIETLNAAALADLAIESASTERDGRDGISYLIQAKRNGINTPLSSAYEHQVLRRTQTKSLEEALQKIRAG